MTAISNYGQLRMALSDHVGHRNISVVLPRLVQMAESYLNRELRTRFQITTAPADAAALPSDFLETAPVYGTNCSVSQRTSSQRSVSSYAYFSFGALGSLALGQSILIDGINIIGSSGGRTISYYAALPTLTTGNSTTNWLLTRYPDVYLYAVGLEAAKYLKDADLLTISKTLLEDSLNSVRIDDYRARWAHTPVRVRGLTP